MAAAIFFSSDAATQYYLEPRWDVSRSLSGAGFGVVATAFMHVWWGVLEGMVGKRLPVQNHRLANTLVKVALDQSIGT